MVATVFCRPHNRLRGFSLVELMVALVIGLFSSIIIAQIFSNSERNKVVTTGEGDALNAGVVAMYAVQREIRMGGYDFSDTKILGCNLVLRAGVTLTSVAPVTVNHPSITGQDANTDTLLVAYGSSNGSPQGDTIVATGNSVQTPSAFSANDWVVETPSAGGGACNLTLDQVDSVAGSVVTLKSSAAMTAGNSLFNLGQAVKVVAYAIRSGNLTMCDYVVADCGSAANNSSTTVWVPISSNIVSLRAQYGHKTTAPYIAVDAYDRTTPNSACLWSRTVAVRMALVARSVQQSASVTSSAPVWDGTFLPNGTTPDDPIVLSSNAAWQNYRYKVFQTVVPVRNVAWMTAC